LHYRLWTAFGYSGDASVPMQLVSVAASLASVYLVHRIALRVGATPLMALAAAGWTAFSYGFWVYSLEADTYVAPLPFVLLSILLLFDVRPTDWCGLTSPAAPPAPRRVHTRPRAGSARNAHAPSCTGFRSMSRVTALPNRSA
jgi:hypothetical protein